MPNCEVLFRNMPLHSNSVFFVIIRDACGILTSFDLPVWWMKIFLTKKGVASNSIGWNVWCPFITKKLDPVLFSSPSSVETHLNVKNLVCRSICQCLHVCYCLNNRGLQHFLIKHVFLTTLYKKTQRKTQHTTQHTLVYVLHWFISFTLDLENSFPHMLL